MTRCEWCEAVRDEDSPDGWCHYLAGGEWFSFCCPECWLSWL